jgi:hypothetical protein
MNYVVITSINNVTESVRKFSEKNNCHVVVIGDLKSTKYDYPNVTFIDVNEQLKLKFKSISTTPFNHYSRKNIGYLYAMKNGAELIYDTDDDTIPYDNWGLRKFECKKTILSPKIVNPYDFFTNEKCWPRGMDIRFINTKTEYRLDNKDTNIGVWQGVIDDDSDFDAIYRLTINKHIKFNQNDDISLDKNCYAPFNTQSTLWNNLFYVLLYIPISVDFRFSDILKGYVAQRIMWDYNHSVGFHKPNTFQVRNYHDFYDDFIGEISMYKNVPKVINLLESINLNNESIYNDLYDVYTIFYENNIVNENELTNLKNWITDIKNILNHDTL